MNYWQRCEIHPKAFERVNDMLYALDEAESQSSPTVIPAEDGRTAARTAVRVLERFYMALASHREHVERLKWLEANRTEAMPPMPSIDFIIPPTRTDDERRNINRYGYRLRKGGA